MLDKEDVKTIQDTIANSLEDFFENVLAPYLDKMTKKLDEHAELLKENTSDHDTFLRKLDANELQHDRILVKLDGIENGVKDHDKRIKRLEKTLAAS